VTEELADLMHRAADNLVVPPAPPAEVLRHGRSVRRRRRIGLAAGATAVLLVAAGLGVAATTGSDPKSAPRGVDPADPTGSGLTGAVFSVGVTVYYDGGAKHATIDDKAIKSSYYTSAGLLVRHGNNNASDGGGPQRFSLVRPDGTVSPVSVVTEETVPGVDPAQPYLAYTEVLSDVVHVVVHDVATDQEVARIPMPGSFEWGGWTGPPVALSGDTVYVGTDDVMRTVNWRTGEIGQTDVLDPGYPDVDGGRTVQHVGDQSTVVDVSTGEVLLSVTAGQYGYLSLSPDGHFATLAAEDGRSFDVYDVALGTHTTFDGNTFDYGWTPEDDLARLTDHHVVTCSVASGDCTAAADEIPARGGGVAPADVRFAAQTYES
jgi:hypothetical protein